MWQFPESVCICQDAVKFMVDFTEIDGVGFSLATYRLTRRLVVCEKHVLISTWGDPKTDTYTKTKYIFTLIYFLHNIENLIKSDKTVSSRAICCTY